MKIEGENMKRTPQALPVHAAGQALDDLRHVWATWHVMAGTPIAELQELGAWKSELMVKRYAHFAPEQLRTAAKKAGHIFGHTRVRGKRGSTHNILIGSIRLRNITGPATHESQASACLDKAIWIRATPILLALSDKGRC
jgi:hypothetical protein